MKCEWKVTQKERDYLRELAKKYIEYSKLPVMKERKELWYNHNSLKWMQKRNIGTTTCTANI